MITAEFPNNYECLKNSISEASSTVCSNIWAIHDNKRQKETDCVPCILYLGILLKKMLLYLSSVSFVLRLQDLQLYHPQLQHYKETSTSLIDWIEATRKKQDALQGTKFDSIQTLTNHINNQQVS